MGRAVRWSRVFVGVVGLILGLGGCAVITTVEVKPSDCINPPTGDCAGGAHESRILEVRLYQLKQIVDPCQIDIDAFAAGKDLDVLKSALVETQRSDALRWAFKVTANEPRVVGSWEILKDTQYVLAVAVGRGKSANTAQVIPIGRVKNGTGFFPTLHVKGYDICLDRPCEAALGMGGACQR